MRTAPRKAPAGPRRPVRRSQEERSTHTRARLLDAALDVLREGGFASLTISKVTQRAGLTNGAMQHHFSARDDLLLALLDAVYPILRIPFDEIAAARLEPRQRIARLIDNLWSIYSKPEYLVVWDIALNSRDDPKLWPRVHAYQREITRHMRSEFTRLFADFDLSEDDAERILTIPANFIRGTAFLGMFGDDHLRHVDFDVIKDIAYRGLTSCGAAPTA